MRFKKCSSCIALLSTFLIGGMPAHAEPHWSGFSVGAHLGYLDGSTDRKLTPAEQASFPTAVDVAQDAKGGFVGAEAGYDHQFGNVVVGVAVDYDRHSASDRFLETAGLFVGQNFIADLDWTASIRARVGYLIADPTLIYATGGIAYAGILEGVNPGSGFDQKETLQGFTLGAGIEHAITDNIFAGIEYRYSKYDETFGRRTNEHTGAAGGFLAANSIEWVTHDIRVSAKYRF